MDGIYVVEYEGYSDIGQYAAFKTKREAESALKAIRAGDPTRWGKDTLWIQYYDFGEPFD